MPIRPVEPTDRAEWLHMRLNLWGGAAEEHTHDIDTYFATIQSGVTFVVERTEEEDSAGLSKLVSGTMRKGARRPRSPTLKGGTWMRRAVVVTGHPPGAGSRGMGEASWAEGNSE